MSKPYTQEIYQTTYDLVLDCYHVTTRVPDQTLMHQLRAATLSILTQLAYAKEAHTLRARFSHLFDATTSIREVEILMNVCKDLGYLEDAVVDVVCELLDTLQEQVQKKLLLQPNQA